VAAGGIHGLGGNVRSGGGECGEDAAGVEPLRTVFGAEDRGPVKIARLELADCGKAAVRAAGGGTEAESTLGKVDAVANRPAYAVIGQPFEQGRVHAALKHEVFDQAANGVIGQCCGDGGTQSEASAQAASNVVLAATFPDLKLARGVYPVFAGVEAKHHFAQAEAVPTAR